MKNMKLTFAGIAAAAAFGLCGGSAGAQPAGAGTDLKKDPTLNLVGYAHLDTEWRWEYPQVIQEYLSKTLLDNFALIEKYPRYVSISAGLPLQVVKEYYPEDYAKLKEYVAAGR